MSRVQRTKNWTSDEDIALCQAWVKVSEDAIVGAGQIKQAFFDKVLAQFILLSGGNRCKRSFQSVESRWHKISPDCTKFFAHLNREIRVERSGHTLEDQWETAPKVFDTVEGGPFKFGHCYEYLHQSPKWAEYANVRTPTATTQREGAPSKKQKSSTGSEFTGGASNDTPVSHMNNIHLSDDEDDEPTDFPDGTPIQTQVGGAPQVFLNIGDGPAPRDRPGGRKAAKEKRKAARQESQSSEVSSARAEYAALQAKVSETSAEEHALKKWNMEWKMRTFMQIEAEKARLAEERRADRENQIMMMDPNTIEDPMRKQYWMDKQQEIFNRRHKEVNDFSPQFSGFSPSVPDDFGHTGPVFGSSGGGFGPTSYRPTGYMPPFGGPSGGHMPGGWSSGGYMPGPGGFGPDGFGLGGYQGGPMGGPSGGYQGGPMGGPSGGYQGGPRDGPSGGPSDAGQE